jgi:hypothetical protein
MRWTYYLIRSLILVAIIMAVGIIAVHGEDNETTAMNTTAEDPINASADINVTEVPPEENATTTTLICTESVCDTGCVICSDSSCHDSGFVCNESYSLEKIIPENISLGESQLNFLLRNTGNVALLQVSVQLSGDGVTTVERIPIESLPPGEKDYAFTKINAEKEGKIDLVIKILLNDTMKDTIVKEMNVVPGKAGATSGSSGPGINGEGTGDSLNVTALNLRFNSLKEAYNDVDKRYQEKAAEGADLKIAEDNLEEANRYLKDSQSYLIDEDYKKLKLSLDVVEYNLLSANNTLNVLPASGINATEISERIDKQKEKYIELEQEYQNKKLQNYYVDMVYDKLKETKDSMKEVENLMLDKEYKKADYLLNTIDESFVQIESELDSARGMTFGDKLKQNMLLFGSIAAAVVSIVTAYSLIKRSVNKDKMKDLHDRLKSLEKGKKAEDKKSEIKSEVKPDVKADDKNASDKNATSYADDVNGSNKENAEGHKDNNKKERTEEDDLDDFEKSRLMN